MAFGEQMERAAPSLGSRRGSDTVEGVRSKGRRRERAMDRNLRRTGGAIQSSRGSTWGPLGNQMEGQLGRLFSEAEYNPQQDVDRAAVDTELALEKTREGRRRELGRMGINPQSGRFDNARWNLYEAMARAGAMTRGREKGRERAFNQLRGAFESGRGLLGQRLSAAEAMKQREYQAAGGFQGLAGFQGELAGDDEARAAFMEEMGMGGQAPPAGANPSEWIQDEIGQRNRQLRRQRKGGLTLIRGEDQEQGGDNLYLGRRGYALGRSNKMPRTGAGSGFGE